MFGKRRLQSLSFLSAPFFSFAVEPGAGKAAPTVPELTAKITELEGKLSIANESATETGAAMKVLQDASAKLTTDLAAATQRADKAEADLATEKAGAATLQTNLTAATQRAENAEAGQTKAKEDLTKADDRAELKVKELYAANGLSLPAKKPGSPAEQTAVDSTLTARQRLAKGFTAEGQASA